jgi:hypothetical protein
MELNERQRLILMGVLQARQRMAASRRGDVPAMSRDRLVRRRLRTRRALAGMVPMALWDWLGRAPSGSERVLCHREYRRLEAMGLLTRCNPSGGSRTTHLKLTRAGRIEAARLLAGEYGQDGGGMEIDLSGLELASIDLPSESQESGNDPL